MRNGLRTLTELVDRVETDGVVVDDVSLSRVEGGELTADFSVTFSEDAAPVPQGSADETEGERLFRGVAPANTSPSRVGRSPVESENDTTAERVTPGFGVLSARVGGSVAGAMAEGLAAVEDREDDSSAPDDAIHEERTSDGREAEPETEPGGSSNAEPITCRVDGCEETFATEHGMKIHATKAHQSPDGSAPSPHRNPERLREVYEACDTFEEMTEALDVDVTPQTVRRSMMRLGVHEPSAEDGEANGAGTATASDATPAEPSTEPVDARTDGAGDEPASEAEGEPSSAAGREPSSEAGAEPASDAGDESATDDPEPAEGDQHGRSEPPADVESPAEDGDDGSPADPSNDDAGHGTADDPEEEPAPSSDADPAPTVDVDDLLPAAVDGDAFVAAVREASTLHQVQRRLDMEREEVQTLLAEFGLLDLVHGRVATKHEREDRKAEIERRIVERAGDDGSDDGGDERSGGQRDDSASDGPGEPASAD